MKPSKRDLIILEYECNISEKEANKLRAKREILSATLRIQELEEAIRQYEAEIQKNRAEMEAVRKAAADDKASASV
jgi:molecular chaperone GrpE (heat shock protein)